MAVVIGDFLFCLLSALDHIVWALVIANPPNKPSTRNQFPICSCHCNFRGELKKGRLDGLSDIALTAVEGLQPYKAGHNLLGLLNGLHNIDKHRRLNVTTVSIDSLIFEWREKGVPVMDYRLTGDGPTNGAELLQGAIAHGLSGGDVKVSGKATGSVLFKDEPGRDLDVLPILEEMLDYFKDSVFPTFEPLFS